jgi:hypothetical protein
MLLSGSIDNWMQYRQLAGMEAQRLLQTEEIEHAVILVEKLGGSVTYPKNGLLYHDYVVTALGHQRRFTHATDMVQWVIRYIVPKVLST